VYLLRIFGCFLLSPLSRAFSIGQLFDCLRESELLHPFFHVLLQLYFTKQCTEHNSRTPINIASRVTTFCSHLFTKLKLVYILKE